jgi:hypothetical protein
MLRVSIRAVAVSCLIGIHPRVGPWSTAAAALVVRVVAIILRLAIVSIDITLWSRIGSPLIEVSTLLTVSSVWIVPVSTAGLCMKPRLLAYCSQNDSLDRWYIVFRGERFKARIYLRSSCHVCCALHR